jgi:peroxiredoxin
MADNKAGNDKTEKARLDRELADKTSELIKLRQELAALDARSKASEITTEEYQPKSSRLSEQISTLEEKLAELQALSKRRRAAGLRSPAILILIAILVIAIGIIVFLLIPGRGYDVGSTAPDLAIQLRDGSTTSLTALHSKNVVLVFWDRDFWDGKFFYVNGTLRNLYSPDKLNQLYKKYSRDDLEIIGVASGTNNGELEEVTREFSIAFPVMGDSFGKLRTAYNITYEPTYVFIDRSGRIRARMEGPATSLSELEQVIYSMDKSEPVKQGKPPFYDVLVQTINEKSASISWVTNQPATTQVDIDGKRIQTVITQTPVTLHAVTLKDLSPHTAYQVRMLYNINNINVSERSYSALADTVVSKRYSFTTSNKDASYPEVSSISTSMVTESSATVAWKTDEPAAGEVDYGTEKTYGNIARQGDSLSIWHSVLIEGLKPDITYFLRIRARDASGRETVQEIEPLKTPSVTEAAPRVGARAPDFKLPALDGAEYTLGQFKGYKILLNFWLEGCTSCTAEMPIIQSIYDRQSRDQLIVLTVSSYGDKDKIKSYVADSKYTFPVLLDTEGVVDKLYKSPDFPTTFFIDTKGVIREIRGGRFQTVSEIEDSLLKLN